MDNNQSLALRKAANLIDFNKLKQGLPKMPPLGSNRGMNGNKSMDLVKKQQKLTMADKAQGLNKRSTSSRGSLRDKNIMRRGTPVFGQDNQINYKLMEKVPLTRLTPDDVRCLSEAIQNLDSRIPTQPDASRTHTSVENLSGPRAVAMPIVSQKQIVESLEQILEQERLDGRLSSDLNPLYRQCLKIHHTFLNKIEQFGNQTQDIETEEIQKLPVPVQVDILLQILNKSVIEKSQRYAQAERNARRASMQKGFIGLLTNMMEQVAEVPDNGTTARDHSKSSSLHYSQRASEIQPVYQKQKTPTNDTLKGHATFGQKMDESSYQTKQGVIEVIDSNSLARAPSSNQRHSNRDLDIYMDAESDQNASSRFEEPTARDYNSHQRQDESTRVYGSQDTAVVERERGPYTDQEPLEDIQMIDEEQQHHLQERHQQVHQSNQQLKSILKSPQSRLLNGNSLKPATSSSNEKQEAAEVIEEELIGESISVKGKSIDRRSPGKSSRMSPERQAARQIEKDNSPVREFLNQGASDDDQEFNEQQQHDQSQNSRRESGRENNRGISDRRREKGFQVDRIQVNQDEECQDSKERSVSPLSQQSNPVQMPDIVIQTSIFDKGHYGSKSSKIQKQLPTLSSGNMKMNADFDDIGDQSCEQQLSLEGASPADIIQKQFNYKLMLKCIRLWRIYAKQEVYRREQSRLLEVEQARRMQDRLDSEIERSKEISEIINECAIARNHYNNHLMLYGFQSLMGFLELQRKDRSQAKQQMKFDQKHRNLGYFFSIWRKAVHIIQNKRMQIRKVQQKREEHIQLQFIQCIRNQLKIKQNNRIKFVQKHQLTTKKIIYQRLRQNLAESLLNSQKAEQFEAQRLSHLISAFKILRDQNSDDRQRWHMIKQQINASKAIKIIQQWNSITLKNRKIRSQYFAVNQQYSQVIIYKAIGAWRDACLENRRVEQIYFILKAKQVFRCLKKGLMLRYRKRAIQTKSFEHLQKVRQQIVMTRWKAYVHEIQRYRNFQLQVFTRFDLFKQRQIFKQWFNQVDVLKKWRFLNENTHLWRIKKMRKRVFRAWRSEIRLRQAYFAVEESRNHRLGVLAMRALQLAANRRRVYKYVQGVQSQNVGRLVLRQWYSLLNEKLRARLQRQKKRDFYTLSVCFDELREYADKRLEFKRGMKSLLKTRARNLMRTAYQQGLKQLWHRRVIDRSLYQAAVLLNKVHLQRAGLRGLQRAVDLKSQAAAVTLAHLRHLQRRTLKTWLRQYLKQDTASRYSKRVQTDRMYKVFEVLRATAARKKSLRRRLLFFAKVHEQYLTKRGFSSLGKYSERRRHGRAREQQLKEELYFSRLKKEAYAALLQYSKQSKEKGAKKAYYTNVAAKLRKRQALNALKRKYFYKKTERALRKKVSQRILQNCMGALIYNQAIYVAEKLVRAKGAARTKSRVFDGLARYSAYKKYFAHQEAESIKSHTTRMKTAVYQTLKRTAARKQSARRSSAAVHQMLARRFLLAWRDEFRESVEQRYQRRLADRFFGRRIFGQLKRGCFEGQDSEKRQRKQELRRLQMAFHRHNSKRRALRRFQEHKIASQVSKHREQYLRLHRLRKLFGSWVDALDLLRRARILQESAKLMERNSLIERVMRALRERADKKNKERLIIERFQERAEMTAKADVLLSLHRHVAGARNQRSSFYKKILFVAERRVARPFLLWMEYVLEHRLQERADKFFRRRKAQYLFRLAWDSLRVFSLHSKQKRTQQQAIDQWHNRMLMQRTTLALKLHTHESQRLANVSCIIRLQSDQTQLGSYFEAFINGIKISKQSSGLKRRAKLFYEHNQYRKTLIGLQTSKQKNIKEKILRDRHKLNLRRECMLKWYKGLIFKRRLQALTEIFQRENDCRMAYEFFPILVKQTYVMQIFDHMAQRRVHNYQAVFINRLRKQILMKKILNSFRKRSQLELMRSILVELKISTYKKQNHKDHVASHIWQVESEHQIDVLQIAFNSLKERVVLQKFKRISVRCHKLKILRKYFCALQEHDIRQKMLRKKAEEVRKMSEAKYFWHWRKAFVKEREKNQAAQFLQSTFLYQVMSAWRAQTNKRLRSRSFFANVVQRNQMQSVLHAWILFVKKEQKNRECAKYLSLLHKQNVEKQYLLIWLSKLSQGRIETQMGNYFAIKTYRKVFIAWNQIKDKNNQKRVNMYRIRAELRRRPELAKPLRALKNFTMLKAFNKLLVGAKQSRNEEVKEEDAQFAYFMKLTKKAFVALKLGAQLNIQRDQTVEMGELNMKKRFLDLMKKGTAYLKERRKLRHKSSIFRFLALQRKALQSLMKYQTISQELRVKKEFALRLYYKRTIDLGFSCLKIYTREKQLARLERQKRQEEEQQRTVSRLNHSELQMSGEHLIDVSNDQDCSYLNQQSIKERKDTPSSQMLDQQNQSLSEVQEVSHDKQYLNEVSILQSYQNHQDHSQEVSRQGFLIDEYLDRQGHKASAPHLRGNQNQFTNRRQNDKLNDKGDKSSRMAAASMYPSVGAINHYQGTSDGYNIFHNISGASALTSAQLSAQQALSMLQNQQSMEQYKDNNDQYDQDSQHRQIGLIDQHQRQILQSHKSEKRIPIDSQNTREIGMGVHQESRSQFEYYQTDELNHIQNSHGTNDQNATIEDDAFSLQSPPKDQMQAPLVMKIDDLLRESRRPDFNLQAAESTSNFQMNRDTHNE